MGMIPCCEAGHNSVNFYLIQHKSYHKYILWGRQNLYIVILFNSCKTNCRRRVAQFGRALRSGRRGRRFKSCRADDTRIPVHGWENPWQGQPQRLLESFWGSFFAFKSFRKALCQKNCRTNFRATVFFILPLQILPGYVADPDLSLFQRMCNMQSAGKLQQIQKS